MLTFAHENLEHVLCALLLISRIGDVATTYLMTPNLVLEANPMARQSGWPFAIFTLLACLLPYVSLPLAVAALIVFLLVSASNAQKIWFARTIGEKAYFELLMDVARKSRLSHALLPITASSFFIALAGGTVLLFYPAPSEWGYWLGIGILLYAGAMLLYGCLGTIRLFSLAQRS